MCVCMCQHDRQLNKRRRRRLHRISYKAYADLVVVVGTCNSLLFQRERAKVLMLSLSTPSSTEGHTVVYNWQREEESSREGKGWMVVVVEAVVPNSRRKRRGL